jgi:hypothetical protein
VSVAPLFMYDSDDATQIPRSAPVVAGYGDGNSIWSPSWKAAGGMPAGANWWDLFPNAIRLVIVLHASHEGDILDVESGAATADEVPGWVQRFNRPGRRRPTIYSSRGAWKYIVKALETAGLSASAVDWWAATLDGTTDVSGAVAVQFCGAADSNDPCRTDGHYDKSLILDPSWVGLSATPTPAMAEAVCPCAVKDSVTRKDGTVDVFAVMPDHTMRHTVIDPDGSITYNDTLPGSWGPIIKARWSDDETVLAVVAYGWRNGQGGTVYHTWWSYDDPVWNGPALLV